MSEKATLAQVTQGDISWCNRRIDSLEKKLRVLLAIMIDKKLVSEEVAKALVQETKTDAILEWYLKEIKKE